MSHRGSVHRVFDTGIRRNWKPEDKATPEQQDLVLELVIDRGEFEQKELVDALAERLPHLRRGSCAAIVSACMLGLHQAGMVEVKHEHHPTVWRVT